MRLNLDRATRMVGRGSLLATLLLTMAVPMVGCSDNADGNPNRESVSFPRTGGNEGGVSPTAPEENAKKAPAAGKKDAARNISL